MKYLIYFVSVSVLLISCTGNSNSKKVTELLNAFELKEFPASIGIDEYDNAKDTIDLTYHDYFFTLVSDAGKENHDMSGYELRPIFRLPSQNDFNLLIMRLITKKSYENKGESICLYTITNEGKILDKLEVYDLIDDPLGAYLKQSFFTKNHKIKVLETHNELDDNTLEYFFTDSIVSIYKIKEDGKIEHLSSNTTVITREK